MRFLKSMARKLVLFKRAVEKSQPAILLSLRPASPRLSNLRPSKNTSSSSAPRKSQYSNTALRVCVFRHRVSTKVHRENRPCSVLISRQSAPVKSQPMYLPPGFRSPAFAPREAPRIMELLNEQLENSAEYVRIEWRTTLSNTQFENPVLKIRHSGSTLWLRSTSAKFAWVI